ncbi:efflux RND transporter periplasmic adaptor subunit [Roseobacter sp. YSTF-M11]|uniref:Efflux RND transporter periplasmic adaptor subunit n=1 Tax=Roseobacter insulae TaxID=2859783 RepID=A0A9X1G007_9RHOB|nr:efflux RND transporter periplasmic adaptor subunit [Roseobacter insulae]MBW4710552.1 efflux RND transporter periplasmic adaptor subunit [Roseobacter insulae]
MRFLRQSMIGLFLAAVTLGLLVYAGQLVGVAVQDRLNAEAVVPPARERVFAVNVRMAEEQTITPLLEVFGEVASRRTLELRAAVGGRVVELAPNFEDGGAVRRGDVLVRIDPADMQSALDRLTADLADAEAEVRDAARARDLARDEEAAAEDQVALRQKAYRRQVDLAARGVGTAAAVEVSELETAAARATVLARRQAVTQAEARIDQAATRLSRAQIALAEAQRNLEDATLEAPFDGTLSETAVVEGRLVSANERLADLIDPHDLEVSFRLSTAQYARLLDAGGDLIKAPVTATLDVTGVDLAATGTLSRVSAAAGEGQTGRLVFARLTDAPGFRPGDFVTVQVREPPLENVVQLPASSLDAQGEVLLLTGDDRLEALDVTLLRRQGDDVLVRGDGLAGREVVTTRTPLLGPGIAVRPLRTEPQSRATIPDMLELSEERRARLVAFVQNNDRMPEDAKEKVLAQLAEREVPAKMVARIESRMGG